jgi:hypothetical protein
MAPTINTAVEQMELNAERSLLLRLPREIRHIIWQEVIGHAIHMEYQKPIHPKNEWR